MGKEKTIYIINFVGEPDSLFLDNASHRDEIAKPFVFLKEEIEKLDFQVKFTQTGSELYDAAGIISFANVNQTILRNISKLSKQQCCLIIYEPPTILPYLYDPKLKNFFGTIFTMMDDLIDNQTYFKFYHYQSRHQIVKNIPKFDDKKLCIMVQRNSRTNHPSELYTERYNLALFFANSNEFDLYGPNWEGVPNWKGLLTQNKVEVLKNYKFCICYENMKDQMGFITERIFETMYGGCVPVYWGATNITDYVPKECFIDRRCFSSNQELYHFMKSIDQKTYASYLMAAEKYLQSPQAKFFSPQGFAESILQRLKNTILSK